MRFMFTLRHSLAPKVLSEWRRVGDRSRLTALKTMYIIVESVIMLNASQTSLALLSNLTQLTTSESQRHVLASTGDN